MEWLKHLAIQKDKNNILANDWRQGASYIKYTNGQLAYVLNHVNDQRQGVQYSWDRNGQLEYEENYDCGQQHGIQRRWCRISRFYSEMNFNYGKPHGYQNTWDYKGNLIYRYLYINGARQL
jgi:antitoxin component YwqK of YwqJK toxin-antitoxin module